MTLIEKAKRELELNGWNTDPTKVVDGDPFSGAGIAMLKTVETFFEEGWSGSIAPTAARIVHQLLLGDPISPLTGADEEWDTDLDWGSIQNRRCGHIFKDDKGRAYNSCARVFREPSEDGTSSSCWSNGYSMEYIEFPWTPTEPQVIDIPRDYDYELDPLNLIQGEMATGRKLKNLIRRKFYEAVEAKHPDLKEALDRGLSDMKVVGVNSGDDGDMQIDIIYTKGSEVVSSSLADKMIAEFGIEQVDSVLKSISHSTPADTKPLDLEELAEQGIIKSTTVLSDTAFDRLQDIIDNPPAPSQNLIDLMSKPIPRGKDIVSEDTIYEPDDGPLTEEQIAEIRARSSATDLSDADFDQKLI
jgi:hypothetical protein